MKFYLLFSIQLLYTYNSIAQTDTTKVSILTETETLKQPQFPGGDNAIADFLRKNMQYPVHERKFNVEGRVLLKLSFLSDGTIDSITIKRGASTGLNEEAIRIVKIMPKWVIDTTNENHKRFNYMLPVVFRLEGETDTDPELVRYNFNLAEKFVPRDTIIKLVAQNRDFEEAFLSFTKAEYNYAARNFVNVTFKNNNAAVYVMAALSYNGDKNKAEVCNNISKALALNYMANEMIKANVEMLNKQCK